MKNVQRADRQSVNTNNQSARRLRVVAALGVLLLLFELSPFGGNITFYSKWIECGQKPVRQATHFGPISSYEESPTFEPVRFMYQHYFCTPIDAENAGLSASSDRYEYRYRNQ